MQNNRSLFIARLATTFIRLSMRLKGSSSRPSAPLGSRILTSHDDIFKHNMWDHIQWTDEEKENARQKAEENSSVYLPLAEQGKFDTDACQYWDKFYETHQDKFFKDRRWLFLEFPELLPPCSEAHNTNQCHSPQQTVIPIQRGSRLDTQIGTNQHNDPVQGHRKTDIIYYQEAVKEQKKAATQASSFPGQNASFRIMEVGCGVGNSVFPIVNNIKGKDSYLYCCDFSPRAIQLVMVSKRSENNMHSLENVLIHPAGYSTKSLHIRSCPSENYTVKLFKELLLDNPDYDASVCHAFVHDICEDLASFPFPPQSLDVILAVFVLSSIHPERLQGVVNRLSTHLKHGGIFLFRDYGRYDFSQLRFKKGQCLSENFYTRGDGTCVYFFTKEDVHDLFSKAGLEEMMNLEDKRLQVNRGKKVAMHRVWMQSKYRKPYPLSAS